MDSKLLNGIKSMYVDSSAYGRIKGGISEQFRIDSGVRQVCSMSSWLFNLYMDGVMIEVKVGLGRRGVSFLEDGREWRLTGPLYADDLVLCGESEEEVKVIVGRFADVCRRRGLKVNAVRAR